MAENKFMMVHEVSRLSGLSVRTLHYYDEIGLLHPEKTAENGYRLYDEESLEKITDERRKHHEF